MQATNMTEWPRPVWTAQKMEESRALARESPGSLNGAQACVRVLAATEGGMNGAKQKLATMQSELDSRPVGGGELRQVIPIALLIHDQSAALHFLAKIFPTTIDLGFAVAKDPEHSVVWMHIVRRSAKFIISDSLFNHDHGEILLQRLVDVYPILAYYLESSLRSDGIVAINLGDAGHQLGLAFCDNRPGSFLIPDSIYMDSRGYIAMREHFAKNFLPWDKRSPTAFWRGTTTGRPLDPKQGWRSLPRVRLCEIGAKNLDIIDAGITKIAQIADPEAEAWIAEAGLLRPFVPPEAFQQYKYQIDIDGNTTSWPGLFIKLLTGSVVLKVPPRDGFEQWYYDRLKPWENFIPLALDMSDLPEKVRWLRANDRVAQTIGAAGYRLAEDLTYEREIGRAAPTVAAAVKDASGQPLLDLDFAVGGSGVEHLREGWLPPEHYGVDAAGFQSRIDLPAPRGIGGFVMGLEVSPLTTASQRLSVALDGELMRQHHISGRTSIYIPMTRKTLTHKAQLALTLLHPDAVPAASPTSPADPRMLAIRLHRIWVLGQGRTDPDESPERAEAFDELRMLDRGEPAHDLNGPAPLIPPQSDEIPLYTYHGTLAYADIKSGRLRHGQAATVPKNLFLAILGGEGVLVRVTATGQRRTIRLRPEGRFAGEADRSALNADGRAHRFTLVSAEGVSGGAVALRAAGMFLCADGSGELEFGRVKIGPWEQFRSTAGTS